MTVEEKLKYIIQAIMEKIGITKNMTYSPDSFVDNERLE